MNLSKLSTPTLLLEKQKFLANVARMQKSADRLGVSLRPHLKTMKSAKAADIITASGSRGITVSTLKEARYFLDHGVTDITYAVGMAASKLAEVSQLMNAGADLKIMTDNPPVAAGIADFANANSVAFKVLIEIDSGDNRGGLQPDSEDLIVIANQFKQTPVKLQGVLTHAGHSYGVNNLEALQAVAEQERDAVVLAATRLRENDFDIETVSVGSTPTALFARDLTGVTELRAGVYTVFDIDQQSRGVCDTDEIALSVLTSVIGHNRAAGKMLLDAGGLALSKDRSADHFRPEVGYGQVCELDGTSISDLYVTSVSQEHGHVQVRNENDYALYPIGSMLRILPIHACMTAAAYDCFKVIENGTLIDTWGRVNGW